MIFQAEPYIYILIFGPRSCINTTFCYIWGSKYPKYWRVHHQYILIVPLESEQCSTSQFSIRYRRIVVRSFLSTKMRLKEWVSTKFAFNRINKNLLDRRWVPRVLECFARSMLLLVILNTKIMPYNFRTKFLRRLETEPKKQGHWMVALMYFDVSIQCETKSQLEWFFFLWHV